MSYLYVKWNSFVGGSRAVLGPSRQHHRFCLEDRLRGITELRKKRGVIGSDMVSMLTLSGALSKLCAENPREQSSPDPCSCWNQYLRKPKSRNTPPRTFQTAA